MELPTYSTSLENCYINYEMDGKATVVDADGNPLPSQPLTQSVVDENGLHITAYYPGTGIEGKVELPTYSTSLENCYINYEMDGKATVVDADGKPLPSQPLTQSVVDENGFHITAYYPGTGIEGKVELPTYSASLENCFAYCGKDGKVTVVGADGKPLICQPLTQSVVDENGFHITAYYAGDKTKTVLSSYLPPSKTPESGVPV